MTADGSPSGELSAVPGNVPVGPGGAESAASASMPAPLVVAVATRPHPLEVENGDAWSVDWQGTACRVVVADGLGHGPEAALASRGALQAIASSATVDPAELLERSHAATRGTRGAAVSVYVLDFAREQLRYSGVGNVEGRLVQPVKSERTITYRGIIGATLPRLRVLELPLPETPWLLIAHTDGVSARFEIKPGTFNALASGRLTLQTLADELLAEWSRPTDDATLVMAARLS